MTSERFQGQISTGGLFSALAAVSTLGGVAAHLWAGWVDEHRLVLRPVGHMTLLAGLVWIVALVVGALALWFSRKRPMVALVSLGVTVLGLVLLAG